MGAACCAGAGAGRGARMATPPPPTGMPRLGAGGGALGAAGRGAAAPAAAAATLAPPGLRSASRSSADSPGPRDRLGMPCCASCTDAEEDRAGVTGALLPAALATLPLSVSMPLPKANPSHGALKSAGMGAGSGAEAEEDGPAMALLKFPHSLSHRSAEAERSGGCRGGGRAGPPSAAPSPAAPGLPLSLCGCAKCRRFSCAPISTRAAALSTLLPPPPVPRPRVNAASASVCAA